MKEIFIKLFKNKLYLTLSIVVAILTIVFNSEINNLFLKSLNFKGFNVNNDSSLSISDHDGQNITTLMSEIINAIELYKIDNEGMVPSGDNYEYCQSGFGFGYEDADYDNCNLVESLTPYNENIGALLGNLMGSIYNVQIFYTNNSQGGSGACLQYSYTLSEIGFDNNNDIVYESNYSDSSVEKTDGNGNVYCSNENNDNGRGVGGGNNGGNDDVDEEEYDTSDEVCKLEEPEDSQLFYCGIDESGQDVVNSICGDRLNINLIDISKLGISGNVDTSTECERASAALKILKTNLRDTESALKEHISDKKSILKSCAEADWEGIKNSMETEIQDYKDQIAVVEKYKEEVCADGECKRLDEQLQYYKEQLKKLGKATDENKTTIRIIKREIDEIEKRKTKLNCK